MKSMTATPGWVIALLVTFLLVQALHAQPAITSYTRSTFTGTYAAISGTPVLSGDDNALNIFLPFVVRYDGTDYDRARICTNGWMELGSAVHPLSFSTTNYNGSLFTPDFPNKTLAPWWDDLATGSGSILYTTLGAAPTRTFVVEWQNVVSYYSGGKTISFELRLYESTNAIEFWYGAAAGTASPNESASFGIEDSTGGSGHFIDGPTGSSTVGSTTLTTTNNWPGVFYRFSDNPLKLLRPNGGEDFLIGTTDTIIWATNGVANVKLEYSPDAGASWSTIIASTPAAAARYPWTVPGAPTSLGMVRISDAADSSKSDVSDSVFTIQFAPSISVAPDSFSVTLGEGDSTFRTMTIGNSGEGDLRFQIFREAGPLPGSLPAPAGKADPSGTRIPLKTGGRTGVSDGPGSPATSAAAPADIQRTERLSAVPSEFLIIDHGRDKTQFAGHTFQTVIESDFASLTLADLQNYKVVYFEPSWFNYSTLTGNMPLLANYVRLGGVAVINVAGNIGDAQDIDPMGTDYSRATTHQSETINIPDHPYISGNSYGGEQLTRSDFDNWSSTDHGDLLNYPPRSQVVLSNSDGASWIQYSYGGGYVIVTTLTYGWGTGGARGTPMTNLIQYSLTLGGLGWVSGSPESGVVPPHGEALVQIAVNARNLPGGDYRANVVIVSNDPLHNPVTVPVHLHVIGKPVITVSPESLAFGSAFLLQNRYDTLAIDNAGSVSLEITSITTTTPVFLPNLKFTKIPPGGEERLVVRFTPPDTGAFSGVITLNSNDSSRPALAIRVSGRGLYPPDMSVTPDSLSVSVHEGDSTTRTMTIGNAGLGALDFSISNTFVSSQGSVPLLSAASGSTRLQTRAFRAAVVNSFGSDYASVVWDSLNANWAKFGSSAVVVDFTSLNKDTVTYADLANSGADVLIISDAVGGGYGWQYSDAQWAAIKRYVDEGHGLIATSGSIYSYPDPTNTRHLAPLVGLDSTLSYSWSQPAQSLNFAQPSHPLLSNMHEPYQPAASYTAVPTLSQNWSRALRGGELVAISPDSTTAVIVYGDRVYISNIPEDPYFQPSHNDYQLLYNSIVWGSLGGGWISEEPSSGTVAPGGTQEISVKFNAGNLGAGDFRSNIVVSGNDPVHSPATVPAHLHVVGKPIISVQPDSIDFGTAFLGYPKTNTLIVRNSGSDSLRVTSITSNNAVFTVDPPAFTVPRHSQWVVRVSFSPVDTSAVSGSLVITSNDSSRLTLGVPVRARGLYPPSMTVTPDSLGVTINQGDSATRTMTVGNTGLGALDFQIVNLPGGGQSSLPRSGAVSGNARSAFALEPPDAGTVPERESIQNLLSRNSQAALSPGDGRISLNSHESSISPPGRMTFEEMTRLRGRFQTQIRSIKAAVLNSFGTDYSLDVWDSLNANWARFGSSPVAIDYVSLNKDTITYADLVNSGADVLIISDAFYPGYGWEYSDAQWGAIKRFVEEGHGLIATSGSLDSYSAPNNVRHLAPLLGLDSALSYDWAVTAHNLNFVQPSHPLLNSMHEPYQPVVLSTASPSISHNWSLALRGGELVAISSDSSTAIIAYGDRVYISNIPEDSYQGPPSHDDFQLLYNAIVWGTLGGGWISEDPASGTVAPGSSMDVSVKFNARDLDGGDYDRRIVITGNDPVQNQRVVPAHLHVIGRPIIALDADSIDFGPAFIGYTKSDTLVVRNTGSDSLIVASITSNNPVFTAASSAFTIPRHSQRSVLVTFTPADTSGEEGSLTITSNDPAHGTLNVRLKGEGEWAPNITVSPDSLVITLNGGTGGDSTSRTLVIGNTGPGELTWSGEILPASAALNIQPVARAATTAKTAHPARGPMQDGPRSVGKSLRWASSNAASLPFYDGFEDGSYSRWTEDASSGLREVTNATSAEGNYSFHYHNTLTGHFHGIHVDFDTSSRPMYAGFFVRSGSTNAADAYFVFVDSTNGGIYDAIFFFADRGGHFFVNLEVGGDSSVHYTAMQWYFVEFRQIDWVNKRFDYYVNGSLIKSGIGFRYASSIGEFRRLYLYNFDLSDAWWDGITLGSGPTQAHLSPAGGAIDPGSTQEITAKFVGRGLGVGNYRFNIVIHSNDPARSTVLIPVRVDVLTGVANDAPAIPAEFALRQNYPNPFNPSTSIAFSLPERAHVSLKVFDVLGREVAAIVDEVRAPGEYTATWNARDIPSGIYFYRLTAGRFMDVRKMTVIR